MCAIVNNAFNHIRILMHNLSQSHSLSIYLSISVFHAHTHTHTFICSRKLIEVTWLTKWNESIVCERQEKKKQQQNTPYTNSNMKMDAKIRQRLMNSFDISHHTFSQLDVVFFETIILFLRFIQEETSYHNHTHSFDRAHLNRNEIWWDMLIENTIKFISLDK